MNQKKKNPLFKKNNLQKSLRKSEPWSEAVRTFTELGQTQQAVDEELAEQGYDDDTGFTGVLKDDDEKSKEEGKKIT
jgi:hypothetical protein